MSGCGNFDKNLKEETHVKERREAITPPFQKNRVLALAELWESIPDPARETTLQTLSQIVVRQITVTQKQTEVPHEDC